MVGIVCGGGVSVVGRPWSRALELPKAHGSLGWGVGVLEVAGELAGVGVCLWSWAADSSTWVSAPLRPSVVFICAAGGAG